MYIPEPSGKAMFEREEINRSNTFTHRLDNLYRTSRKQ
jgi:hypothetical protein